MKIPKGFIKDSEGIYRRGNFVFKDNKIFRESSTVEELKENYPTMQDCIREVLSFYSILGDKPRTTNVYIDKAGKGFKSSEKFSKNTVAVITPDRNVFEVNTTNIGDSTDFKDLVNKDKKDLPKNVKSLKTFSSDKPKDFDKLNESAEDVEKFWSQGFKIGDTVDSSGAGRVEILDLNKDADYIVVKRQTGFQPFVACWAPSINEEGKLYWGQGHYFSTEEDAKEYFSSKLNESEKLNEATKFYNTEEPNVYIEISNGKVSANPAGKVLDVDTLGLVQNGDTVYVITSDGSDYNTIYAYSVDYQFPYEFKYTQEK